MSSKSFLLKKSYENIAVIIVSCKVCRFLQAWVLANHNWKGQCLCYNLILRVLAHYSTVEVMSFPRKSG